MGRMFGTEVSWCAYQNWGWSKEFPYLLHSIDFVWHNINTRTSYPFAKLLPISGRTLFVLKWDVKLGNKTGMFKVNKVYSCVFATSWYAHYARNTRCRNRFWCWDGLELRNFTAINVEMAKTASEREHIFILWKRSALVMVEDECSGCRWVMRWWDGYRGL